MLKLKTKSPDVRTRSYQFSLDVIEFLKSLPNQHLYWSTSDQLLRSSTSIGANLVEAKGSSSKKDFINFYFISLKSANETIYWLKLFGDSGLVSKSSVEHLLDEANQISKMIGASVIKLKANSK